MKSATDCNLPCLATGGEHTHGENKLFQVKLKAMNLFVTVFAKALIIIKRVSKNKYSVTSSNPHITSLTTST
jgi:hypothetical protein